jgi:ABC-type siderophore export system fused ATPase/permease subunit
MIRLQEKTRLGKQKQSVIRGSKELLLKKKRRKLMMVKRRKK